MINYIAKFIANCVYGALPIALVGACIENANLKGVVVGGLVLIALITLIEVMGIQAGPSDSNGRLP